MDRREPFARLLREIARIGKENQRKWKNPKRCDAAPGAVGFASKINLSRSNEQTLAERLTLRSRQHAFKKHADDPPLQATFSASFSAVPPRRLCGWRRSHTCVEKRRGAGGTAGIASVRAIMRRLSLPTASDSSGHDGSARTQNARRAARTRARSTASRRGRAADGSCRSRSIDRGDRRNRRRHIEARGDRLAACARGRR